MSQLSLTEGNVRRALSRFAIPFLVLPCCNFCTARWT